MVQTSKNKTLGRRSEARRALLLALSNALIQKKNITTTITKAKALARFIAPIITKARKRSALDANHAHREAFSRLRNKESVKIIFDEIVPKVHKRAGGYTRIIKLNSWQKGSGAKLALIELVDFNPLLTKPKKVKTRRGRRKTTQKQPKKNSALQQSEQPLQNVDKNTQDLSTTGSSKDNTIDAPKEIPKDLS